VESAAVDWFGFGSCFTPTDTEAFLLLGAAGHIILTPANQLMATALKIWSLYNPGFEPRTF
jgi:hypothetical protein